MHHEFYLAEMDRRFANMIRLGKVQEIDHKKAKVRIAIGGLCTDFLPWITSHAGKTRNWSPPSIGEQVMVLSPGGDLGLGVVLPSIYQNKFPAPNDKEHVTAMTFADGATVEYDSETKALNVKVGQSSLKCTEDAITIKSPLVTINGKVMI